MVCVGRTGLTREISYGLIELTWILRASSFVLRYKVPVISVP